MINTLLGGLFMAIPFTKINRLLETWAANNPPIEDFTVENVLFEIDCGIDKYEEVLRYLMSKTNFELIPKKMILCPNNHKGPTFLLDEPIDQEEIYDCWCGAEDYYDPQNMMLVFCFTEQFKDDVKKKILHQYKPLGV